MSRLVFLDAPETILNIPAVTQPLESLLAVRTLFEDASKAPDGTALIGHFIVPHFPYSLDATCAEYDGPPHYLTPSAERVNTSESWRNAYIGYVSQTACVYRTLDQIFRDSSFANLLNRSTVIIHGDHGSGISFGNYEKPWTLSASDLVSRFATHFSVRHSDARQAVIEQQKSVHRLFYATIGPNVPPWEENEAEFSTRESLRIPVF